MTLSQCPLMTQSGHHVGLTHIKPFPILGGKILSHRKASLMTAKADGLERLPRQPSRVDDRRRHAILKSATATEFPSCDVRVETISRFHQRRDMRRHRGS